MGRFYQTAEPVFLENTIYTPNYDLMKDAILVQDDKAQNINNTINFLNQVPIDYADIDRERVEQISLDYQNKANNLVNQFMKDGDLNKLRKDTAALKLDFNNNVTKGDVKDITDNYKEYQRFKNQIEKEYAKSPAMQQTGLNMLNDSNSFVDEKGRLKFPSVAEAINYDERFVKEILPKLMADKTYTVFKNGGYETVSTLTEKDIYDAYISFINSDPNALLRFKQTKYNNDVFGDYFTLNGNQLELSENGKKILSDKLKKSGLAAYAYKQAEYTLPAARQAGTSVTINNGEKPVAVDTETIVTPDNSILPYEIMTKELSDKMTANYGWKKFDGSASPAGRINTYLYNMFFQDGSKGKLLPNKNIDNIDGEFAIRYQELLDSISSLNGVNIKSNDPKNPQTYARVSSVAGAVNLSEFLGNIQAQLVALADLANNDEKKALWKRLGNNYNGIINEFKAINFYNNMPVPLDGSNLTNVNKFIKSSKDLLANTWYNMKQSPGNNINSGTSMTLTDNPNVTFFVNNKQVNNLKNSSNERELPKELYGNDVNGLTMKVKDSSGKERTYNIKRIEPEFESAYKTMQNSKSKLFYVSSKSKVTYTYKDESGEEQEGILYTGTTVMPSDSQKVSEYYQEKFKVSPSVIQTSGNSTYHTDHNTSIMRKENTTIQNKKK